MLGVTDSGIRRLIERGAIKATKYGKTWLIRPSGLEGVEKSKAGRPRKERE